MSTLAPGILIQEPQDSNASQINLPVSVAAMSSASHLHPALLHAIQHAAICHDQQAIALLLCTSKQLTITIHAHCSGLVPIKCRLYSLQQALKSAQWLAAHGSLARSLDIGPYDPTIQIGRRRDKATAAIAEALAHAASSKGGLMLEQVVLDEVSNSPTLLQQLAHSSQLTGLTLLLPRYQRCSPAAAGETVPAQDLVPALAGLTSLRSLTLFSKWHYRDTTSDDLLPALQHLSNLTLLTLGEPRHLAQLQQLPVQLQKLHLIVDDNRCPTYRRPPLQLAHLTALKFIVSSSPCDLPQLCKNSYSQSVGIWRPSFDMPKQPVRRNPHLQAGDQLPPALTELTVAFLDQEMVPQLQHLRRLAFTMCLGRTARLEEIGRHCCQLTSLQLTLNDWSVSELQPAATTAALHALPLTDLHVELYSAVGTKLQQLAAASKTLTSMSVESFRRTDAAMVAAVVQQLTGLQKLRVRFNGEQDSNFNHTSSEDDEADEYLPANADQQSADEHDVSAGQQLIAAVASLQRLHCFSLTLGCWESRHQVFSTLNTATQLTALQLRRCGLGNKAVDILAAKLTGLRELDIGGNRLVDSRILSVIGKGLKQLTYLNVCETLITQVDVCSVPQLSVLRMGPLRVKKTVRSWRDVVMDLDE